MRKGNKRNKRNEEKENRFMDVKKGDYVIDCYGWSWEIIKGPDEDGVWLSGIQINTGRRSILQRGEIREKRDEKITKREADRIKKERESKRDLFFR